MPKYKALFLLWSPTKEDYIQPGETFDIAEEQAEAAKILLDKGLIEPAAKQPTKAPVVLATPVTQAKSEE